MTIALLTTAVSLGVLMTLGCFVPRQHLPARMPHDSLLHISAFVLLALPIPVLTDDLATRLLYGAALYVLGIGIEIVQMWIPNRRFGSDDIFYNGIGILIGTGLGTSLQTLV